MAVLTIKGGRHASHTHLTVIEDLETTVIDEEKKTAAIHLPGIQSLTLFAHAGEFNKVHVEIDALPSKFAVGADLKSITVCGDTYVLDEGHTAAKTQVGKLAAFIMQEVDGEPSRDEGAVECAIRLLRESQDK